MVLVELIEGLDLTNALNVKKYEKPIPANLAGKIRGNFPSFIRKTDQERIQNCFDDFWNKWREHQWEVTLKLDGSSFTAYLDDDRFGVCSRNLDLIETDDNAFWQVARKIDLENKMRATGLKRFAIQGELMGPGVQDNREQLTELQMFVFDMFDITQQSYINANRRLSLIRDMGLQHVPVIENEVTLPGFLDVKTFLRYAERPSLNPNVQAEGVVFKSLTDPNVSFKAISNKYLLSGGE